LISILNINTKHPINKTPLETPMVDLNWLRILFMCTVFSLLAIPTANASDASTKSNGLIEDNNIQSMRWDVPVGAQSNITSPLIPRAPYGK
jgi:hypothetical protein